MQANRGRRGCADPTNPACTNSRNADVMGWHDAREIPNYWRYAQAFVLQDRMFEPNASWSLPEHLFQVSEWSALCTRHDDPSSCTNALQSPGRPPDFGRPPRQRRRAHGADLCVDRSDVPAAPEPRELGILRRRAAASRIVRTIPPSRASLRSKTRRRRASGTRCRTSTRSKRTASWATSVPSPISTRPRRKARCRPSRGSRRRTPSANTRRARSAPDRRTSPA